MSGSHIPITVFNLYNHLNIPTGIRRTAPHAKVVKRPSMVNHYIW